MRVTKREKRACRCCERGTVTSAPLEARIVEKSLASNEVVIATVVGKYCDYVGVPVMLLSSRAIAREARAVDLTAT